jgi:hypothetical protein
MPTIRVTGKVDEQHLLMAYVPASVVAGPVELAIVVPATDAGGQAWTEGISREWADELANPLEDIYTLGDGEPVNGAE